MTGAADAQIAIKRDQTGTICTTLEWMKDGPEGVEVYSKLELVEVGVDDDGDVISSCVVEPVEAPAEQHRGPKLTKNQQTLLTILQDAMPNGLTQDEWNDQARDAGLGVKRRSDLLDLRSALKRKGLVHTYAENWYITTR